MAIIQHSAKLNSLLIDILRSLLQYAGESSLWIREGAEQFDRLRQRQQLDAALLAQVLGERGWPVEAGAYPTEYTDLHYVSFDFLRQQIIVNQRQIVAELDEALHTCGSDDPEGMDVVRVVLASEQDILRDLEQFPHVAQTSAAPTTAAHASH